MRLACFAALALVASACRCDGGGEPDDAGFDAGHDAGQPPPDAGAMDAGTMDAGEMDAGAVDAGRPPPNVCPPPSDAGVDAGSCPGADLASDPLNCGRCGRVCGSTATCSTGLCGATLVMDPDVSSNYCHALFTPDRLFAVTCWGNNDLSELRTAPIEPGSDVRGTSLVAYNNVSVVAMRGLTRDGDDILFGLEGNPSRVFQVSATDGGPISTRFTSDAGTRFDALQVVDDTYYWIQNRHTSAGSVVPGGSIKSRARTATEDTVLVPGLGLAGQLVVTAGKFIWIEARTSTSSWAIYEAPRTGGDLSSVKQVAPVAGGAFLIRSGDYVYWTDKLAAPNGRLRRYQFGHPDAVAQDIVTGLASPEGLTTDGTWLYFKQADALYRVGLCGGVPEQLSPIVPAHDAQATEVYAADGRYIYFAAGSGFGDSKIYRVAK